MAEKSLVTNHPLNQTLLNLAGLFEQADFRKKIDALSPELRASMRAIELFTRQTTQRLQSSSDFEVSFPGLRQLNGNLVNVWNEINAFTSNQNEGHLTNAVNNLDGALSAASWAFFDRPPKGGKAFGEMIGSVEKAAEKAISRVSDQAASVDAGLHKISSRIDEADQKVGAAEQKLDQLTSASDARLSEITAEFATIKSEIEAERAEDRKRREAEFEAWVAAEKAKAQEHLQTIAGYEQQAKTIVQVVGNIGVTGNYQLRAEREETQANRWRVVTVTLFGVGVVFVAINLLLNLSGDIDLSTLVARFAIAVAVAAPAIYTARESARHRTNADRAKQTELELASLVPFLENLEDGRRQEIISELATAYFGRSVGDHLAHAPVSLDEVQKTLGSVSDLVGKVRGA